jgi:hypothetical protein
MVYLSNLLQVIALAINELDWDGFYQLIPIYSRISMNSNNKMLLTYPAYQRVARSRKSALAARHQHQRRQTL